MIILGVHHFVANIGNVHSRIGLPYFSCIRNGSVSQCTSGVVKVSIVCHLSYLECLRTAIQVHPLVQIAHVVALLLVVDTKVNVAQRTIISWQNEYYTSLIDRCSSAIFAKRSLIAGKQTSEREGNVLRSHQSCTSRVITHSRKVGTKCSQSSTHSYISCSTIQICRTHYLSIVCRLCVHSSCTCHRNQCGIYILFHSLINYLLFNTKNERRITKNSLTFNR